MNSPICHTVSTPVAPVAAYEGLYAGAANTFLYESLESRGSRGRYSFIGGRPRIILQSRGREVAIRRGDIIERQTADPLDVLREIVRCQPPTVAAAPFSSGAVGYLAYDIVRQFETLPDHNPDELHLPEQHACWFRPQGGGFEPLPLDPVPPSPIMPALAHCNHDCQNSIWSLGI